MIQLREIKEKINNVISTILEKKERSYRELGEVYHLSEYLPYKWYDEEKEVYVSENDVGIIFGVYPLVGNSESMQKELSNIFTQILPEGSNIQVMFYADKNIKDTLDDYVNSRKGTGKTLEVLAERRAKHLEKCALKSNLYPYVLRDFKGYISITIPIRNKVKETLEEITSIKKQISSTMNIVGVSHFILEPNELMRLIDGIFNRALEKGEDLKRVWNSLEELNSQMISYETDLEVEEDLLKLHEGELEIKTFSINGYPGEWTLYQMGELIGDLYRDSKQFPYPYIFHYGIHIPKQSNGAAKIAVKANLVEKQLRSPVGKYIPNIEREHTELEFVQQNLTGGKVSTDTIQHSVICLKGGYGKCGTSFKNTIFIEII